MAKKQAAAPEFVRVNNSTLATCTICNNTGSGSLSPVVLQPGVNEGVPAWVAKEQYFKDLRKEKILNLLAAEVEDEDDAPVINYKLDGEGNKIQALDANDDPLFDDVTGEPVYVIEE